jgi:hypothetical protein
MPKHFARIVALLLAHCLTLEPVSGFSFLVRQTSGGRETTNVAFISQALALNPVFHPNGLVEPIREATMAFETGESDQPLFEIKSVMHPENDFDRAIREDHLDVAEKILEDWVTARRVTNRQEVEMRRTLKVQRNHVVLSDAFVIIDHAENAMFDLLKKLNEGTFSTNERRAMRKRMRSLLRHIQDQYQRILALDPPAIQIMSDYARNTLKVARAWMKVAAGIAVILISYQIKGPTFGHDPSLLLGAMYAGPVISHWHWKGLHLAVSLAVGISLYFEYSDWGIYGMVSAIGAFLLSILAMRLFRRTFFHEIRRDLREGWERLLLTGKILNSKDGEYPWPIPTTRDPAASA